MNPHRTAERLSLMKARVLENARRLGLEDGALHALSTSYGGLRLRFVHAGLARFDDARRRSLLAGVDVDEAELLTPDEEQWYPPLTASGEGPLPMWAEVLEHSMEQAESELAPGPDRDLVFASDLDRDIDRPAIVTFYSLRGGVGRTTALAAVARILADRGRRVLCVDMDFEAPGLPYLLGLKEPTADQGALPLLLALEQGADVDIRDHVERVSEANDLYCLPAGRLDADYAERLRLVDPHAWYAEEPNPLHALLDRAKQSSLAPDIILLDARTGMSAVSAPLLFDVADLAVICFFPHPQARRGTELLVRSLLSARTRRSAQVEIAPEPRFLVGPLPPGPSADRVRERAMAWIDGWLDQVQGRRSPDVGQIQGDELTHVVPYSPDMAYRDRVALTDTTRDVYGPIADWLEQLLPQLGAQPAIERLTKREMLDQLSFSAGTAEEHENFAVDFVQTPEFEQAMDPNRCWQRLGAREASVEGLRRYRVPDLYRLGLGMSRKGQA